MSSEHPKHNEQCKSDEHTKHLCYYTAYGCHLDNPEEYKDLVEKPRYKCHVCGRTAHLPENVCMPIEL